MIFQKKEAKWLIYLKIVVTKTEAGYFVFKWIENCVHPLET